MHSLGKITILGDLAVVGLMLFLSACGSSTQWTPVSPSQNTNSVSSSASSANLDKLQQVLTKAPLRGEGGSVEVQVTYDSVDYFKALAVSEGKDFQGYDNQYDLKNNLVFTIAMNTHSVDLSKYKMESLTVLRDDTGTEYAASRWDVPEGTVSHHTTGTLTVPAVRKDGKLVTDGGAKYIELVIKDLSGVPERVFHWDLPVQVS